MPAMVLLIPWQFGNSKPSDLDNWWKDMRIQTQLLCERALQFFFACIASMESTTNKVIRVPTIEHSIHMLSPPSPMKMKNLTYARDRSAT